MESLGPVGTELFWGRLGSPSGAPRIYAQRLSGPAPLEAVDRSDLLRLWTFISSSTSMTTQPDTHTLSTLLAHVISQTR